MRRDWKNRMTMRLIFLVLCLAAAVAMFLVGTSDLSWMNDDATIFLRATGASDQLFKDGILK